MCLNLVMGNPCKMYCKRTPNIYIRRTGKTREVITNGTENTEKLCKLPIYIIICIGI